jgi:acetyl esterase/lipase
MTTCTIPVALAERLRQIGPSFDLPAVQALYQPLLAAQPRDGVALHADLAYGDHPRQVLDVYRPTSAKATGTRLPVLVFFHGGGFIRGDKSQRANVGWHFARQQVLTVVPNYRLAPDSTWPSGPQDVVAVWRWLREYVQHHGGDPERILLMGESAGAAHVAAATLMRRFQPAPSDWKISGAVLLSGPYNARLEGMARRQFAVASPDPRNDAYFGPDPASWDPASIVDHIDAAPFPLLISYAERDLVQMQVQAGELFARLVSRHGFNPGLQMLREHNHFSQGLSIGTDDDSVSGPLLRFLRAPG